MWTVKYNISFSYRESKSYRYDTRFFLLAYAVYLWYGFRYVLTIYPVRELKIFKADDNLFYLKDYSKQKEVRRESL